MVDSDPNGMTFRELIMEVRDDVKDLKYQMTALDGSTVKKEELEMWKQAQNTTKRWAITTIISLLVLGLMALGIVVQLG